MLKAIHAQEDVEEARDKAAAVADKLETMKLYKAAEKVRDGIDETLSYYDFPLSTTVIFGRIIRWRRSCVRSAAGAVWSAASLTATVP